MVSCVEAADVEDASDKEGRDVEPLPDLFANQHFLLYGDFEEAVRRRIVKYIIAYNGYEKTPHTHTHHTHTHHTHTTHTHTCTHHSSHQFECLHFFSCVENYMNSSVSFVITASNWNDEFDSVNNKCLILIHHLTLNTSSLISGSI